MLIANWIRKAKCVGECGLLEYKSELQLMSKRSCENIDQDENNLVVATSSIALQV